MIKELHADLQNRKKTVRSLVEHSFEMIDQKEEELHAFLSIFRERAFEQADTLDTRFDRGESLDLLAGIPFALKDNLTVAGTRTTAGSKILDNYIAPYDAAVVEKLKERGALLIGKTNLDEFAFGSSTENSAYGPSHNPFDPTRVSGGSSGGSAVSVAADFVTFALGSDTGGSIRQPASFCGVVGLKPTYGRVSRSGLIAMASSLDQIGPFGKSVEDVATVFSRITGRDARDATTAEKETVFFEEQLEGEIAGKRIGIPEEYFSKELDERVRKIAEASIETLRQLGCEIVPIKLPASKYALPVYYILMPAEVSSNLARLDGIRFGLSINDEESQAREVSTLLETYLDSRRVGFGAEVKRRVMLGTYALSAGYYDAYYQKAQKVRSLIRQDFEKAFEKVDVIFSPTTPEVAFPIGAKSADPLKMYLSDVYTVTANLVGVPAISFPMGTIREEEKDLPLGGQLMGKWFDEAVLLRLAHAFEKTHTLEKL